MASGWAVRRGSRRSPETIDPRLVAACSLAVALALSLQFLLQPFIWRNFGVGEILAAWFAQALNNLVVAGAIAAALIAAQSLSGRWPRPRLVLAAIVVGALVGEAARRAIFGAAFGPTLFLGVVVRWSVVAGALAWIYFIWRGDHLAARAAEEAEAQLAERQRLASSIQFAALQSQIEPHFLFNTLATAQGLYRQSPAKGDALLSHLARYMRSSAAEQLSAIATLGDELKIVRAYLAVCKARMGRRLSATVEVPAELRDRRLPPLALATLVENAIIHGLEPRREGGSLRIVAQESGQTLNIAIEDDGVGFSTASGGAGIGLANTRARLRALFGDRASLSLEGRPAGGVSARIQLPSEAVAGLRRVG